MDVPATAKVVNLPRDDAPLPSQKKRKAAHLAEASSRGNVSQPSSSRSVGTQVSRPTASQRVEEEALENEVTEEDSVDELYTALRTDVVGIQYYTGPSVFQCFKSSHDSSLGLVGPQEEVLLIREPHNKFDR